MNKILSIFFVRREEAKGKRWHRLALVFIYGSTLFIAIFLANLLISNKGSAWIVHRYIAYSFEEKYTEANGEEIRCVFKKGLDFGFSSFDETENIFINCGGLSHPTGFLEMYITARGTSTQLKQLRKQTLKGTLWSKSGLVIPWEQGDAISGDIFYESVAGAKGFADNELKTRLEGVADKKIMTQLIKSGELTDVKVKRATVINYENIFVNLTQYILLVIAWIIFWESIIYRTVLFIVYGRGKN